MGQVKGGACSKDIVKKYNPCDKNRLVFGLLQMLRLACLFLHKFDLQVLLWGPVLNQEGLHLRNRTMTK